MHRGRFFLLLWLAVYPLLLVVGLVLERVLPPGFPAALTVLITSGAAVGSMTFLITPALLAVFGAWLTQPDQLERLER
jgi:antibiotic biosynthesis monooxygenase (ABM) superfamily enzyme